MRCDRTIEWMRKADRLVALLVTGVLLTMDLPSAPADELTAEESLARIDAMPLPPETAKDRGLLLDGIAQYIVEFSRAAEEFQERFPNDPRAKELAEREIDLLVQIRTYRPSLRWNKRLDRISRAYPETFENNSSLVHEELHEVGEQLERALSLPKDERDIVRRRALDWAAAHSQFDLAVSLAYRSATDMGEDSPAERKAWLEAFRLVAPGDPRADLILEPAVKVGEPLELEFIDVEGNRVNTADLKGKTIVIDFWATWCAPCIEAGKQLIKLKEQYGEDPGLEIIGVSIDDRLRPLTRYLKRDPYPWPVVWDETKAISSRWHVRAIPDYLVIDAEGILRHRGGTNIRNLILSQLGMDASSISSEELPHVDKHLLAPMGASAEEMIAVLRESDSPSYASTKTMVGVDDVRAVHPLRKAAFAASVNELTWRFIEEHGDDASIEEMLSAWVWSMANRDLRSHPEVLVELTRENFPDLDSQVDLLPDRLKADSPRAVMLAALIRDVQGAAKAGLDDGELKETLIRRVREFCEAEPDDPLNVLAFFGLMKTLDESVSGDIPADISPSVPLRLVAQDLRGNAVDTAMWRGNVVLIYYSYYPQSHMPYLRQLWREYHDQGLEIVEISLGHDRSDVDNYVRTGRAPFETDEGAAWPVPWPVVHLVPGPRDWNLRWLFNAYPISSVLDREGRLRQVGVGVSSRGIQIGGQRYSFAFDHAPLIEELMASSGK